MKRGIIILLSFFSVGALGLLASSFLVSSGEPSPLNADCTVKGYKTELYDVATHDGIRYELIEGRDPISVRRLNVIEISPEGCKLLAEPDDDVDWLGALVPEEVANPFAVTLWQQAIDEEGKAQVERSLSTTTIGRELNSRNIYSEDIYAFEKLGIKYPEYFKSLDSFDTPAEAREYYDTIFTEEWHKANPRIVSPGGLH